MSDSREIKVVGKVLVAVVFGLGLFLTVTSYLSTTEHAMRLRAAPGGSVSADGVEVTVRRILRTGTSKDESEPPCGGDYSWVPREGQVLGEDAVAFDIAAQPACASRYRPFEVQDVRIEVIRIDRGGSPGEEIAEVDISWTRSPANILRDLAGPMMMSFSLGVAGSSLAAFLWRERRPDRAEVQSR